MLFKNRVFPHPTFFQSGICIVFLSDWMEGDRKKSEGTDGKRNQTPIHLHQQKRKKIFLQKEQKATVSLLV